MSRLHRAAGHAVFVHECELGRHALTVSWGAGYPALDVNSMPQVILPGGRSQFCLCGGDYERVPPCPPDPNHDCHPIAGHVERSDDHTADLIEGADPDPDEEEIARLRLVHWELQQKHLISELEQRVESFQYQHEHEKVADQLALALARRDLRRASLAGAETSPSGEEDV